MAERRPMLAGSPVFWTILKFVVLGPLLRLLFRPRVSGLEHIPIEGGAIVAANHVSFLDPLLLPLVVPRRVMFLAKMKYIDKPLLRWFLRAVGVIPVATDEPGGTGGAASAVAAGVRAVRDGRLVGIFPEGTRSPDGRLHRGKTGVVRIAIQAGVPVIPAGITGTDLAFPRGARLPRPRSVRITFGPPIRFAASAAPDAVAPDAVAAAAPDAAAPAGTPDAACGEPSFTRHATDQVMAAIGALSGQQAGADIT
jgi:1-acyl-sn-glycerol-3-phosphate acyltransferase